MFTKKVKVAQADAYVTKIDWDAIWGVGLVIIIILVIAGNA